MNTGLLLDAAEGMVTPVAAVDVAVMEANLRRMAAIAARAGVRLRPHAKTHKSPAVGRLQVAGGAVGLTVATLHEAEVFLDAGIGDLLIAHPPAGRPKLERLGALARRAGRLAVALDSIELASALPDGVEVMWEVDTGHHRVGSRPGEPAAQAVARLVAKVGRERFRGLLTHGGHAYAAGAEGGRRRAAQEERDGLLSTAVVLRDAGIQVRELSSGSTPTAGFAPDMEGLTEIRPGTYVYGDANQVALGVQPPDSCALGVVATVVSTPDPGRAVIDAGSKALAADMRVAGLEGYGLLPDHPGLVLERLSEEHGVLLHAGGETGLAVGDRLVVIPAHACTTVNLHPEVLMVRADGTAHWDEVAARGWR